MQDTEQIQEVVAPWRRRWGEAWSPKHRTRALLAQLGFSQGGLCHLGGQGKSSQPLTSCSAKKWLWQAVATHAAPGSLCRQGRGVLGFDRAWWRPTGKFGKGKSQK